MAKKLSTQQINNLQTGTDLAAELRSEEPSRRRFLKVAGYLLEMEYLEGDAPIRKRPTRVLNADHSDVHYRFRIFDIETKYIEQPELTDSITSKERTLERSQSPIPNIEELEVQIAPYLEDFSALRAFWLVIPYY